MGSPEKPIDVELGTMDPTVAITNGEKVEETQPLNEENAPLNDEKTEELEEESRFTGLKKEELMEVANQPHWKRARLVLFILFWILWIGMLVAAIMLVYSAPKCKPTPTAQWYQDAVLYKADPKDFAGDYKGVANNMKYIKDMKTTLLLNNVMGSDMKTPLNDAAAFNSLVKTAHADGVKVVVELKVDSLPVTSTPFNDSQAIGCSTSADGVCSMFSWAAAAASGFVQYASAGRTDSFYKGDSKMAAINYASNYSHQYLDEAIGAWLKRGVDGVFISDLSEVVRQGYDQKLVVQTAYEAVNKAAVDKKTFALFVSAAKSADALAISEQYSVPANESVGVANPVVVYRPLSGTDFSSFVATVSKLRSNTTRGFSAFQNDAAFLGDSFVNQSLALTLLNLGLPGVPVIKAGEELGSVSKFSKFAWDTEKALNKPVAAASGESKSALDMVQNMVKKRVADTLAKPALRYDTRDVDTKFYFATNGTNDVIVYCRKWAKKPAVMVVSNVGSSDQQVTLDYKSCDEGLQKSTVMASSTEIHENLKTGSTLELEKFKTLPGFTTLVLTSA